MKFTLILILSVTMGIDTLYSKVFNYNVFFNKSPYNDSLDLQLINIITQAKSTIDAHFYDIDRDSIVNAFLQAANSGVKIRIITDSDNWTTQCDTLNNNVNINVINDVKTTGQVSVSRQSHNKFAIFDYNYLGDSKVKNFVWTGSYNITDTGTLNNANNAILIMETNNTTLAGAYTTEFNEMWGSSGFTFNAANSKFGSQKTDNTTHLFSFGSGVNNIESYFSPSDSTAQHIVNAVNTANYNIFFCIFTFTTGTGGHIIFSAMSNRKNSGVVIQGVFDSFQSGGQYSEYNPAVSAGWDVYTDNVSGNLLHHKYMIIDYGHPSSDPILITGSHNWTESADSDNDENTLIIHDNDIVNAYFKEFYDRFTEAGGTVIQFGPQFSDSSVTPDSIYNDNSEGNILKINITVTEPGATNLVVWANMSNFGGTNFTYLYDDGTHGDLTASDNIYTINNLFVNNTNLFDLNYISIIATDKDNTNSTAIPITIKTKIPRISSISYTPLTNNLVSKSTIKIKIRDDDTAYSSIIANIYLSNFYNNSNLILYDNGEYPDITAGDKIFTFMINTTNKAGDYYIPIKLTDGIHSSLSNFSMSVIQDIISPDKPGDFYLTSSLGSIILHLTAPNSPDIVGIQINYTTNSEYPNSYTEGTVIIHTNVIANKEYQFKLDNLHTGIRYYFSAFTFDIQKNYSLMSTADGLLIAYDENENFRLSDNLIDLNKQNKVEFYFNENKHIKAYIYNIRGTLVKELNNNENYGKITWFLKDNNETIVGSGLYFVFIDTGTKIYKRRILIVN